MFAAAFSRDRRPIDARSMATADGQVAPARTVIAGRHRQVAFLSSEPAAVAGPEPPVLEALEDRYWIAGRVRLDARHDLERRLPGLGTSAGTLSDAMLCLHAYRAWGDGFLDRLSGDFCFALWDEDKDRLVAARDQLGVRALFHADGNGTVYISDSLDWLARRPGIDLNLDDYWVADYLTNNFSLDLDRTVYRGIRRLPPAHALAVSEAGVSVRRYWSLEIGDPIYLRGRRAYTERFRELLAAAISDRLPAGRVGISMSGGLDSTALAASTVAVTGDPSRVVAECSYFRSLMPDDEPYFSSLAARRLGIDLELRALDDTVYDPAWRTRPGRHGEPTTLSLNAEPDRQAMAEIAARAPVWFYGEGPDNALRLDRDAYFSWLRSRRDWPRLLSAAIGYARVKGLAGWAATWRRHTHATAASEPDAVLPPWINSGWSAELHLAERLDTVGRSPLPRHPWHPDAIESCMHPVWQRFFGDMESSERAVPMVWRHPYLDLRVLTFMLSVPPVPWAWEKRLLREAMQGILPSEILTRRKTPLAAEPLTASLRGLALPPLIGGQALGHFIDLERVQASGTTSDAMLRVHALDHWLAAGRQKGPVAGDL